MKKMMCVKGLIILVLFVVIFGNVFAQDVGNIGGEGIGDDAGIILNKTAELKDIVEVFTDENKTDFLSGQWKGLLLRNAFIASIDWSFRKANIVFVILFARVYDLSLELFFAFIFWLFTFLSLRKYSYVFFTQTWQKWLVAFGGVIILAHIQMFNYLSREAFKLIFYKAEWYWKFVNSVILFVAVIFYYFINKYIAASINKKKEEEKKKRADNAIEQIETITRELEES